MTSEEAFVTLATNDTYGLGALVLASSLKRAGTSRQLAILITPGVSASMKSQLSKLYNVVQVVDVLDSNDAANLTLLARPELGITLTKLHAWNLTQFKKAVFLDADCLVIKNVDELFEREELSAVSDCGWPDCFNTGVFVFRPNAQTYANLIKFAAETGSFDGGDQGLLNSYFSDWATKDINKRLPFIYNMVATIIYSYAPAFKQFGHNVKIVHFLGNTKPWHQASAASGAFSPALGNFLQLWWQIYISEVHGSLGMEPGLAGLAGQISQLNLGTDIDHSMHQAHVDTGSHRREWESGNIDYKGADSFSNIERRIQDSIQKGQHGGAKQPSPPPAASQVKQPTPPPQHAQEKQPSPAPASAPVHPAKQSSPGPQQAAPAPQQSLAPQGKQPTPPPASTPVQQASQPAQAKQQTPPPTGAQQVAATPQQTKQPSPPPASAQAVPVQPPTSVPQAKQPSPAPAGAQVPAQSQAPQGKQPTPPPTSAQQPAQAKQPSPAPAGTQPPAAQAPTAAAPGAQQVRSPAPQAAPANPSAGGKSGPQQPQR